MSLVAIGRRRLDDPQPADRERVDVHFAEPRLAHLKPSDRERANGQSADGQRAKRKSPCRNRRHADSRKPDWRAELTVDRLVVPPVPTTELLAAARRIPESIAYVRDGEWRTWGPLLLLGQEVSGATIGIVGLGRIGKEVAKRARGFNMRILAFDPFEDTEFAREHGVTYVPLEQLLAEADFVTLHVALTAETHHLIGANELQHMKATAILVNASRGPVVDTSALVDALRDGSILGAALDVTDPEPLPADHPLVFMPNCIVVPHTASATVQTRNAMAELAARNLLAGLRGEHPPAAVNADEVL